MLSTFARHRQFGGTRDENNIRSCGGLFITKRKKLLDSAAADDAAVSSQQIIDVDDHIDCLVRAATSPWDQPFSCCYDWSILEEEEEVVDFCL